MNLFVITAIAAWLVLGLAVEAWLATRQWRHLAAHAGGDAAVAGYGQGRVLVRWLEALTRVVRVALWLGAGALAGLYAASAVAGPAAPVACLALFAGLDELLRRAPAWFRWAAVDTRRGMSNQSAGALARDTLAHTAASALTGALAAPWLLWPFAVFAAVPAWIVSALLVLAGAGLLGWLKPQVIAPLFNRFEPLAAGELRTRLQAMMARCDTRLDDVLVMDSSRRSRQANAYFTGIGRSKRVVLFDTLIEHLQPAELEAVMAHELGHYRCGHVQRYYALLGALIVTAYAALGLMLQAMGAAAPVAVAGLHVLLPALAWPLQPWLSRLKRRYEYEADAYAATHAERTALVSALRKLLAHNLSAPTMDGWYAGFYATHPPGDRRLARLGHGGR